MKSTIFIIIILIASMFLVYFFKQKAEENAYIEEMLNQMQSGLVEAQVEEEELDDIPMEEPNDFESNQIVENTYIEESQKNEDPFFSALIATPYSDNEPSQFFDDTIFQEDLTEILDLDSRQQVALSEWKRQKHESIAEKLASVQEDPDLREEVYMEELDEKGLEEDFLLFTQNILDDEQLGLLEKSIETREKNKKEIQLNQSYQKVISSVWDVTDEQKDQIWNLLNEQNNQITQDELVDLDAQIDSQNQKEAHLQEILTPRQYLLYLGNTNLQETGD